MGCSGFTGFTSVDQSTVVQEITWDDVACAVARGSASDIRALVNANPKAVEGVDANGDTLLHHAVCKDVGQNALCLEVLLERPGASMNAVNDSGWTAMHCAAAVGHAKAMRILARSNAKCDILDRNSQSPLHLAALGGYAACLDGPIGCGIDVLSVVNGEGRTVLHLVASLGNEDCAKVLLRNRPPRSALNAQDNSGRTAVHEAAGAGAAEVLQALMVAGASITIETFDGTTPLQLAVFQNHIKCIALLTGREVHHLNDNSNNQEVLLTAVEQTEAEGGAGLAPASAAVAVEIQKIMDSTWKNRTTRDRSFSSVPHFTVVQVLENTNSGLWEQYTERRGDLSLHYVKRLGDIKTATAGWAALLHEPLQAAVNEAFLFHGTVPAAVQKICADGFRVDLAGTHRGSLYGPGIYLAEASSKADEYAGDDKVGLYRGLYAMLFCRVSLGNPVVTTEDSPNVNQLQHQLSLETNHSILGDRETTKGTFREFVVPTGNMAFPAFVVIYRRSAF